MNDPSPARRRTAEGGLAALSAITGIISYEHGLNVARWVGNSGLVAYLIPLVPDLMIVTSSITLIEAAAVKARRPWMAMVSLAAGIGWTVAMNVAAGSRHGTGGALLAGGVPVAFVATFESLLWLHRRGRGGETPHPAPAAPATCGHVPAMNLDEAIRAASPHMSQVELAAAFGKSRTTIRRYLARDEEPVAELAGAATNGDGPDE